jgi:hypothetical protein
MRWLPMLVLLLVAAGCSDEERRAPVSPAASPVRSDEHRFTYELPAGWERATRSLTPNLGNPVEILAAGTVQDMRPNEGYCGHMPVGAIERMGPRDVFVTVMEGFGESPAPERPQRFTLPDEQEQSDATECAHGEPPLAVYWFEFRDARRRFYVLVALGRDAPLDRREEALGLLDSLRFEPGPEGVHLDPDRVIPHHDEAAALSWQMPQPPWRRYDWPLTSVREPRERLFLGTFELERRPPDGDCTPRAALDAMPPDGALIHVFEYVDRAALWRTRIPERAGELTLGVERAYECMGNSRMVRWREGDRIFQAHLSLGPDASDELLSEARSILNSVRVG